METNWTNAFQVFAFGFGGVFLCLLILTTAIQVNGSIIHKLFGKKKA
ncbi:MAG: hypothetical protein J7M06_00455 [Proteobacteria bacterium]|nr:hypothetical protein [Pseudomonadota bacterium]